MVGEGSGKVPGAVRMIFGMSEMAKRTRRERWKSKFALFPTHLSDGRWIWLEVYWMREVYHPYWPGWPFSQFSKLRQKEIGGR